MGTVFLAGASGVIGRRLVPRLLEAGHRIVALTRSEKSAAQLVESGVEARVGDVFDRERTIAAIVEAAPDAVVHQLTAIPPRIDPRKVAQQMEPTNRLRREATSILLEGAEQAGAKRFVAQSISFVCRPDGAPLSSEEEPLYLEAPASFRGLIAAVNQLETTSLSSDRVEGIVLRYGFFTGPGTVYAADGPFSQDVARRRIPIVGSGAGVFSFIHVDDASDATIAAISGGSSGVYNIVDDQPMAVADWLPRFAARLGARPPFRVPRWLGRLGAGPYGTYLMCEQRGASNTKAKRELGFRPRVQSFFDAL